MNVGSRQNNRSNNNSIFNTGNDSDSILEGIKIAKKYRRTPLHNSEFGSGNSNKIFLDLLNDDKIWKIDCQKQFQDIDYE